MARRHTRLYGQTADDCSAEGRLHGADKPGLWEADMNEFLSPDFLKIFLTILEKFGSGRA